MVEKSAILQSIRPYYCFGIAFGILAPVPVPNSRKEYEVRKTKPKIPTPFKTYIYCCKSDEDGCVPAGIPDWLGKVPMEYVCDEILEIKADDFDYGHYDISDDDLAKTHLTQKDLWEYGKGKTLYLWHISDLVIYDEPKELFDFIKPCIDEYQYCQGCEHGHINYPADVETSDDLEGCFFDTVCLNRIRRAPQSWCYVKED